MSRTPGPKTLGNYEVLDEIGRGRRGVVYRVRETVGHRLVALKVVSLFAGPEGESDSYETRFFAEAHRAARLSHPVIVPVVDVIKDAPSGALCVVFELVDGRPLSCDLQEGRLFPWREALSLVRIVAAAMQHAHENGVVHGAINPSNLMLLPTGEPKLTDFGIAQLGPAPIVPWPPHEVSDALLYLSPEQVVGEHADCTTDVFSLGAIAYRLLTGRSAFEASDTRTICSRIIHDQPPPPSSLVPGLPSGADEVVARALAKSRKDRYHDAGSLSKAITDILEGRLPVDSLKGGGHEHRGARVGGSPPPYMTLARRALPAEPALLRRRLFTRGLGGILAFGLIAVLEALRPAAERPGIGVSSETSGSATLPQAGGPGRNSSVLPNVGLPSIKEPSESARLVIALQHPLRAGTLRIVVDDTEVSELTFHGSVTRSILGFKLHGGRTREVVEVVPGRRRLNVQVHWEDGSSSAAITGAFEEGSTRRLSARMSRFSKDLNLEWQ